MNIEIREPKLETLIHQRMATGLYETVEDALIQALEATPSPRMEATPKSKKMNFAQFLLESPLAGADIEFERMRDYPKIIEL